MSLFKKPSRKFRQRVVTTESDEENNDEKEGNPETISTTTSNDLFKQPKVSLNLLGEGPKAKPTPTAALAIGIDDDGDSKDSTRKGSNLLSFHDDEDEEEVFKIKKSNYSRRLAKQRSKERKKLGVQDRHENLDEAKEKNGKVLVKRIPNEPTIIVKPLTIPNNNHAKPIVLNGDEAESVKICSDDDDSDSDIHHFNPIKNALSSGLIPDAATIYAVKKHRQMAREQGEFIPVEDPEKFEKNESRLVRDDDNDRSDDEEPSRINFSVNVAELERQKTREAFLSAENLRIQNEEADELEEWEKEQMRKGVGVSHTQSTPSHFPEETTPIAHYETVQHARKKAALVPQIKKDKSNLSTESIKERLKDHLSSLDQVHRAHQRELESYREELDSTLTSIDTLEKEAPSLGQRFTFYQELRAYVEDLIDCLDIKIPKVDILEEQIVTLSRQKTERLIARRQQDIKDQAEEFSMLANRAMRGLSIEFDEKPLSDEIKLRRSAEREGRRMRRRKKRETTLGGLQHQEGLSTDDEEVESDLQQFRVSKENLSNEAKTVFEDVVEEFGSLEGVRARFERWRFQECSTYKEAYIPLCLPNVFSAFVRLNLLFWNPLEEKNPELETLSWYKSLATYGWKRTYLSAEDVKSDPDLNLLPNIVDRVVLPKLTTLVQQVWDPLSTRQTLQLIKQLTKLCQEYPSINSGSKRLQTLLKAVVSRFQKSLEDDIFVPIYPKQLMESRTSNAVVFFQRQFWTCVKLLRNILTCHSILADEPLQELALGCLLNRYVILALQCFTPSMGVIEKCKTIVTTFPRAWFVTSNSSSVPQLDMFQRFLMQLVSKCSASSDCDTNSCAREIAQMLVRIGAVDKAAAIVKEYNTDMKKN